MTTEQAARHLHGVARGLLHERAARRRLGEREAARLRQRLAATGREDRLGHLVDEVRHQWHESRQGTKPTRPQLLMLWTAVHELHVLSGCQADSRTLMIGDQLNPARTIEDLESRLAEAVENLRDRSEEMVTLVAERETAVQKLEDVRKTEFDWTYSDGEPGSRTVRIRFDGDGPAVCGAPTLGQVKEGALHAAFFHRLAAAAAREAREGERRHAEEEADERAERAAAEARKKAGDPRR